MKIKPLQYFISSLHARLSNPKH